MRSTLRKLTAGLLVFLFLLMPLAQVYAEESAQDPEAQEQSIEGGNQTIPEPESNSENEATTQEGDEELGQEEQAVNTDNPPVAPLLENEKAPRRQLAQPDEITGALTYEYPIIVPPGRNGIEPRLSLVYNSQANDKESFFGQGWSLTTPFIERVNKKGTNTMYSDNFFNSYVDGELVNIGGNNYGAKIDNGGFIKYSLINNIWTAIDKAGTVYTYGMAAASRQDDPANSGRIYKWMLTEIRDANNNYLNYEYSKDGGQIYLDTIFYTGNGIDGARFSVTFAREARTDSTISYKTGFAVTTSQRIKEIRTNDLYTGQWLKKYILNYTIGDNTKTSILSSITESGQDNDGVITTLVPSVFEYQLTHPTTAHWTEDTTFSLPTEVRPDWAVITADVNSDGYDDVLRSYSATGHDRYEAYLNDGNNNWVSNIPYISPIIFGSYVPGSGTSDQGAKILDVNGDGRVDIVQNNGGNAGGYLNTGSGWQNAPQWTPTQPLITHVEATPPLYFANVNGDGLPDLIKTTEENQGIVTTVFMNTGNGWLQTEGWNSPRMINYAYGSMLVDVNGDGLDDILESIIDNGTLVKKAYLNNGHGGWDQNIGYEPPVRFIVRGSGLFADYGVRFVDINGDGLLDILQGGAQYGAGRSAYINTGSGWSQSSQWSPFLYLTSNNYSNAPAANLMNLGKSLPDMLQTEWSGDHFVTYAFTNNEKKVNLLKKILPSTGGTIEVTYQTTSMYKNGSALLNPDLPMVLETVMGIITNDGNGVITNSSYSYEGGLFYYSGPFDSKFAGFSKITRTDSNSKIISYYHQGNTTNSGQGELDDHASKIGRKYREEVYNLSGSRYSTKINRWSRDDLGNGRNFVSLATTISMLYDGNASHKDTATSYTYNVSDGNVLTATELGEVQAQDNGTISDIGTDLYNTSFAYALNVGAGIIGLLKQEQTHDYFNQKVKETLHYYDGLPWGQVNKGNETETEIWRSGTKYIDIEKTYNNFGNIVSEKDPRDKETIYTYDIYNLYPISVTNSLNQTTSYEYDYSLGKPKRTIDPNGKSFYTDYDGLDRVIAERQPDVDNPSLSVIKASYEYVDTPNAVRVKQSNYLDANNIVDSYTYFDGLGRKVQERQETASSGQFNVRDFVYTQGGLLLKESLPYESSGIAKTSATTVNNLYTIYTYDALKRVVTAQTAVGTTTNNYDDWKTTVTDAKGKLKDIYRDAYDNLVRVDEHNGSSIYTTSYEWSGLKKLKKITDALGNIRNFTYDGLARVITAEDLHASNDTTFGTWQYAYDASGNLVSRVDPSSVMAVFTYDDLNRLLSEDAYADGQVETFYEYDTCTEGVGRLCRVNNPTLRVAKTYNALGQMASEEKRIGRAYFISSYGYDRQGNQLTVTNPDNSQVKYTYSGSGLVNQIQRKEASESIFTNVVSSIAYNPVNLPTVLVYGNGATTTNTYDANELYRLRTKITQVNNENVQHLTYTYDQVGNIAQIVDASATQTAKTTDYTYDDLHRLLSTTISNSVAENVDGENNVNQVQTFSYDAIGNILFKSDVGAYSYDGNQGSSYANPHAVTSAGIMNYEYDKNGNLTRTSSMMVATQKLYVWDYNNRLLSVKTDQSVSSYAYDADGQRVKSVDTSGTTLSITKEYTLTPSATEKHIFFGDTAVATVRTNGLAVNAYNIHADHLTGSNVITDASQNVDELTDYYAFGTMRIDQQNSSHNEKRKYTGHEYDSDTGLTYANARYYDAGLGRWLSQDQVFLDVTDDIKVEQLTRAPYVEYLVSPQTLNPYSYVDNNPLKYRDVTGDSKLGAGLALLGKGFAKVAGPIAIASNLYDLLVPKEANAPMEQNNQASNQGQSTQYGFRGAGISVAGTTRTQLSTPYRYLDNYNDIIPGSRQTHILIGDATGGGHLFGANKGKAEFPKSWDAKKIFHNAADVATDPGVSWELQATKNYAATAVREGITMRVIIDKTKSFIVTAFPVVKKIIK